MLGLFGPHFEMGSGIEGGILEATLGDCVGLADFPAVAVSQEGYDLAQRTGIPNRECHFLGYNLAVHPQCLKA